MLTKKVQGEQKFKYNRKFSHYAVDKILETFTLFLSGRLCTIFMNKSIRKLDGVALLITDPPSTRFNTLSEKRKKEKNIYVTCDT